MTGRGDEHAVAPLGHSEGVHLSAEAMDALNEYCRNGWVEIDNNLCENALRVVALGRNYMFFGSDGGGDSAAVMYSLIGSCKLNGIEPEAGCAT